jgi:Zn-dependent protease
MKPEKVKFDLGKYHSETVRIRKTHHIRTSNTELLHIVIAWLSISFAFAILLFWFNWNRRPDFNEIFYDLGGPFLISCITVGLSFLAHEMSHKFVAQRYGSWAEFRMNPFMLILMLLLVYGFGILFAAPGAVMIYGGNIGKRENGRISLAGPLSNLILGAAFLLLSSEPPGFIHDIGRIGVLINVTLALFNMIPFGIFDGKKVWDWNKPVYILFVTGAIVLLILSIIQWMPGIQPLNL